MTLDWHKRKYELQDKINPTEEEKKELAEMLEEWSKFQEEKDAGFRRRMQSLEPGEEYHGFSTE